MVTTQQYSMYVVIPFAFQESKSLLHDCMTGSKLIDWSQGILLYAIHEYFENAVWGAMEYLEKTTELELYESMPGNYYFKSKSECLAVDIKYKFLIFQLKNKLFLNLKIFFRVPDGFELKFLHESDVKLVHDLWPREEVKRNPEKSMNFVGTMIKLNKGMGLFTKKDGKLVSWALQNSCGGLALVQTLDEYQKKGYAKIVVSAFSKYLACEDNMDVTLFIVRGNTASEKLFTSLNYKKINTQLSMVTKPLRND